MIVRQRRACSYASLSGGGAPSGMTGAVPATCTWRPATTAREKPATGSYGEPEEIRRRAIPSSIAPRGVPAAGRELGRAQAAVGVLRNGDVVATYGPRDVVFRWASVTKPVVALATLVAAEEGTIDLDAAAGPEGSTVRHLLAHASGLPFDGDQPIAKPGRRRIYSNTGFEQLADTVARASEMPFEEYLRSAVFDPLGLRRSCANRPRPASTEPSTICSPSRASFRRPRSLRARRSPRRRRSFRASAESYRTSAASTRTTGARRRAARCEAAPLDRPRQLGADVRAPRR
jgi:CubicO group peptidase (beta-lactamase class C family)